MTIWKQRFYRWNFFFLYRIWHNTCYILFSWKMGRRELIAKLWVIDEIHSTILYLLFPFIMPIALIAHPALAFRVMAIVFGIYSLALVHFNIRHLQPKKEMVAWKAFPVYFIMKYCLQFVNALSIYHAIWAYGDFFSKKHPRVFEDFAAISAAKECLENMAKEEAVSEKIEYNEKSSDGSFSFMESDVSTQTRCSNAADQRDTKTAREAGPFDSYQIR